MATWKVDEYDLSLLHLDPRFHDALLKSNEFWIRKAVDVRNMIYLNATDPSRSSKDQWWWMEKFQQMLVDLGGKPFLPGTTLKEEPRGERTREEAREPEADDDGDTITVHE